MNKLEADLRDRLAAAEAERNDLAGAIETMKKGYPIIHIDPECGPRDVDRVKEFWMTHAAAHDADVARRAVEAERERIADALRSLPQGQWAMAVGGGELRVIVDLYSALAVVSEAEA